MLSRPSTNTLFIPINTYYLKLSETIIIIRNYNQFKSTVEDSGDAEKTTNFYYDNNGNQISKLISVISSPNGNPGMGLSVPGTGGEITYEIDGYDDFGRLISVQNDLCSAVYTYNADGLRTSKEVTDGNATVMTRFLYDGGLITLELDGANN